MDPEAQGRFEKTELKLSEHDEQIIAHDKSLTAIRNLLGTGMRMLIDMETKMLALTDSETRLYGAMQQLAEAHRSLTEAQRQTAEAHRQTEESLKRFEDSLKRFLDRGGNGHQS